MSAEKRVLHDNRKEALPMAFPDKGLKHGGARGFGVAEASQWPSLLRD